MYLGGTKQRLNPDYQPLIIKTLVPLLCADAFIIAHGHRMCSMVPNNRCFAKQYQSHVVFV